MLTRLDYKTASRLSLFDELIITHYGKKVKGVYAHPG